MCILMLLVWKSNYKSMMWHSICKFFDLVVCLFFSKSFLSNGIFIRQELPEGSKKGVKDEN